MIMISLSTKVRKFRYNELLVVTIEKKKNSQRKYLFRSLENTTLTKVKYFSEIYYHTSILGT